jgi:hypothetical protein
MIAPALRACISGSDNPVTSFADVSEEALFGAVDASIHSIKHQLLQTHRRVKSAVRAKAKIQEEMDREPSKSSPSVKCQRARSMTFTRGCTIALVIEASLRPLCMRASTCLFS